MYFKVYVSGKGVKSLQLAFSLHVKFLKCIPVDGCKPREVQKRPSVSFDCGRTFHGGNKAWLTGPSPLKHSQVLCSFPLQQPSHRWPHVCLQALVSGSSLLQVAFRARGVSTFSFPWIPTYDALTVPGWRVLSAKCQTSSLLLSIDNLLSEASVSIYTPASNGWSSHFHEFMATLGGVRLIHFLHSVGEKWLLVVLICVSWC